MHECSKLSKGSKGPDEHAQVQRASRRTTTMTLDEEATASDRGPHTGRPFLLSLRTTRKVHTIHSKTDDTAIKPNPE